MVFTRILRVCGIAENVITADGLIAAEKDISTPFTRENSFGRSRFVTRVDIDRAPTFRRPTDNLDREIVGLTRQDYRNHEAIPRSHRRSESKRVSCSPEYRGLSSLFHDSLGIARVVPLRQDLGECDCHRLGVGISNGQKPTLDCERLSRYGGPRFRRSRTSRSAC